MSASEFSSRRDFLRGKPLRDRAAEQAAAAGASPAGSSERYLVQFRRAAMACEFAAYLVAGQYPHGPETVLETFDLLETLEQQLSVYRESSEISAINRTAAQRPVEVEPRLFALFEQCLELHRATEGAFDITSGPLIKAWGFSRRQGAIPTAEALAAALENVGSQWIDLDRQASTISLGRPGVELNLGSIGKGYALDRCAEQLALAGVDDFLWHGGQSSVLARGNPSGAGDSAHRGEGVGWCVGVADPFDPATRLAEIWLQNQALGTSGASVQFFRHEGKRYGHLLDPRTGWPAEGVFSATAIAPTAAAADALATAFYVLGVGRTAHYCAQHPEVGALLTHASSSGSRVEISVFGLAADQVRLLDTPPSTSTPET